ncbi:ferredoxin [Planctomycetes bacterium K23_9]
MTVSAGCGGAMIANGCGGATVANGCGGDVVTGASLGSADASGMVFGGEIVSAGPSEGGEFMSAETLCEPVTMYKVVMEPKYVTESQAVCVQKTRTETRYRTKTTYRSVPITETKYRSKVIQVPKTDSKTVSYSVLVPVKSENTVTLTETVPVWNEVPEQYMVRVPQLVDVPEQYTVKVAKLQDEAFTYTVNVPHAVSEQRMHSVTNAVPVTKTRTVQVCVPTTKMQTVTKDFGHWEDRVVEVPAAAPVQAVSYGGCAPANVSYGASSGRVGLFGRLLGCNRGSSCGGCGSSNCGGCVATCGGCGSSNCGGCASSVGCGSGGCGPAAGGCGGDVAMAGGAGCGTTTMTQKVWVPNVRSEQVSVTSSEQRDQVMMYTVFEQQTTQVPYECTRLVYRAEQRSGTKKTVVYVDEPRTRMRKVVKYNEEPRTRMRKELTYTTKTRTETIPHISYSTEPRTKQVSYTYNVPEYIQEPYQTTRYERVAEDQVEEYTVEVPYTVTEERKVQVCKMVPRVVAETASPCTGGSTSLGASVAPSMGGVLSGDLMGGQIISSGASTGVISGGGCGCGGSIAPTATISSACGGCGAVVGSPCGCN